MRVMGSRYWSIAVPEKELTKMRVDWDAVADTI